MSDDPTQVLKVYFVVDCSTLTATPNEAQWVALFQRARGKPLAAAILAVARAAQHDISVSKRARGSGLMKYTLGTFEVSQDDKQALLTVLNAQAVVRSVTGNAGQKFAGVLQAELREAAVDLGYSGTQANRINVTLINPAGVFDRTGAIAAVQAYLSANTALWYGA